MQPKPTELLKNCLFSSKCQNFLRGAMAPRTPQVKPTAQNVEGDWRPTTLAPTCSSSCSPAAKLTPGIPSSVYSSPSIGFIFIDIVGRPRTHVISRHDFGSRVYLRAKWS